MFLDFLSHSLDLSPNQSGFSYETVPTLSNRAHHWRNLVRPLLSRASFSLSLNPINRRVNSSSEVITDHNLCELNNDIS